MDTHYSVSAFPVPPRRGSGAGELLPENRIIWVKGRWDKYLEERQERIIAKYIKASAACSTLGSWEGNVLREAVKGGPVKCSALALATAFVPSKTDSYVLVDFGEMRIFAEQFMLLVSSKRCSHAMTLLLEETTVIEKYFVQNYFIRHR